MSPPRQRRVQLNDAADVVRLQRGARMPAIKFSYDPDRAMHAALWFLKRRGILHRVKLVKLIAFADVAHICKYGRPIAGGQYKAMAHGPVSSEFYDQIKHNTMPGTTPVGLLVKGLDEPNEDFLSETDLEVLQEVDAKFGNLDWHQLENLTHEWEGWKKNWEGGSTYYPMSYNDLLIGHLGEEMRQLIEDNQDARRSVE